MSKNVPWNTKKRASKVKLRLAERDGWKCRYCSVELTVDSATIDHIVPLSRGGINDWRRNLCLACAPCNWEKDDMTEKEFLAYKETGVRLYLDQPGPPRPRGVKQSKRQRHKRHPDYWKKMERHI